MSEPLLVLRASLAIYAECARDAFHGLMRNWIIIPWSIGLLIAAFLSMFLLGQFGDVGGMIAGLVVVALISYYYSWINAAAGKERLRFSSVLPFDWAIFFSLVGLTFVLWTISLLLGQAFAKSPELSWIPICFNLAIFILLNTLPEEVHEQRLDSFPALAAAFQFNKENWIEWYLPLVAILLPALLADWSITLVLVAGTDVLLPIFLPIKALNIALPTGALGSELILTVVLEGLLLCLGTWFMLFRTYLFRALSQGTRRRRIYQLKQR